MMAVIVEVTVVIVQIRDFGGEQVLVPILPIVCLSALYASGNRDSLSNVSMTFFGIFYISIPISLLNFLVFESGEYEYIYLVSSFVFLWISESTAFIGGSIFGKNKQSSQRILYRGKISKTPYFHFSQFQIECEFAEAVNFRKLSTF